MSSETTRRNKVVLTELCDIGIKVFSVALEVEIIAFNIPEVVEVVDHIVKMALIIRQAVISGINRNVLLVLLHNRFVTFTIHIFLIFYTHIVYEFTKDFETEKLSRLS